MKLTSIEKETIINFNEAERTASIYTHNEALKRQLLELCQTHPEQVRQTAANGWGGLTFELPKKWLRVTPPRVLSPAQRAVLPSFSFELNEWQMEQFLLAMRFHFQLSVVQLQLTAFWLPQFHRSP